MRILLLPVTTARAAIFCQRQAVPSVRTTPRLDDRLASRGEKIWRGFETSDKKWKQAVVRWIGKLLDTVQFEESCLRTLPPRNTWKRRLAGSNSMVSEQQAINKQLKLEPVELVFPSTAPATRDFNAAHSVIVHQARQAVKTHRKQIVWCVAGLPLTLPVAINPFIPNFPAFYLIYRMWCNWKALKAAHHLLYLSQHHQLSPAQIKPLDDIYASFPARGCVDDEMVDRVADVFNDNLLRRELHHAVRQIERAKDKRVL